MACGSSGPDRVRPRRTRCHVRSGCREDDPVHARSRPAVGGRHRPGRVRSPRTPAWPSTPARPGEPDTTVRTAVVLARSCPPRFGSPMGLADQPGDEVDRTPTITTPNTYDKTAWESTVRRIRGSRTVVSDTW